MLLDFISDAQLLSGIILNVCTIMSRTLASVYITIGTEYIIVIYSPSAKFCAFGKKSYSCVLKLCIIEYKIIINLKGNNLHVFSK